MISVTESGPGIPEANRDRVFDPFFSTKHRSKNSGLGLAMVKGAVERFGGHVDFASTPGEETRVSLLLMPRSAAGRRSEPAT